MVTHARWSRDLGAPQVFIELGSELRALGHEVAKFSYEDAFPHDTTSRRLPRTLQRIRVQLLANRRFPSRCVAFVRANGAKFDVIDADHPNLPFPKTRLGFPGLLVARSTGLIPSYRAFERWAARRWPRFSAANVLRRGLNYPGRLRQALDVRAALDSADLINVSSSADLADVRQMGYGAKALWLPLGLSMARAAALRAAVASEARSLEPKTVAFVGSWNPRKGSEDWPVIVSRLRKRRPATRFLMLGASIPAEHVRASFAPADRSAIEVIPTFANEELPALLSRAWVGAFPGYLEGFGLAVLEMAAAGLPLVAYDAPGPRDILSKLRFRQLIAAGDVDAFVRALDEVLDAGEQRYAELSADSLAAAACFSWPEIARQTVARYEERLGQLTRPGSPAVT